MFHVLLDGCIFSMPAAENRSCPLPGRAPGAVPACRVIPGGVQRGNIHSKKVSSAEQELAVLEAEALAAALRALNHMKVWNSHLCKPEALCALSCAGDRRRVF